jgi:hypothetical protein
LLTAALSTFTASQCLAQITPSDGSWSVVDRGSFYRVLQRAASVTNNLTGEISQQVQSYTELEDGMNYLSNGVWVSSQDLVEVTATGAQAVHGQMTGLFDSDITSVGAITLTKGTELFQSHPIGLFYTDYGSGKVAKIGSVQPSVGTLYPPNVIVFSNAIPELADLMLVWAKNGFEQNVVLKKNPPPPSVFSMSSSSTTLQFWTEMDTFPTPLQQRAITLSSGLVDHIYHFQDCWFPVGSAFDFGTVPLPPQGQAAQVHVIDPSTPGTVQVAKSIQNIAGSTILVEEVKYTDLLPLLSALPQASLGPKPAPTVELANRGQYLPAAPVAKPAPQAMQVASAPYSPKAVALDYTLNGTVSSFTFSNDTYLITNTFTITPNTATFSNNACIKYSTNAYLLLEGPVSFPSSGSPVVFTSIDDNAYGVSITNSSANPYYCAKPAIWMYYRSIRTTVQDVLIRWAQQGMKYTEESGSLLNPNLNSSVFQDCTTGVYVDIVSDTLQLSGDTFCNVTTPVQINSGYTYGSMTKDCGVVTVAMVNDPNRDLYGYDTNKNSQTECSFVVIDSTNIVAAFMNTHLSEYGLGEATFSGIPSPRMATWAVSRDGGTNFIDNGPVPPISTITNGSTVITNGAPNPTVGDAGDTVMTYDSKSNIVYLLTNPSRESGAIGFRLWASVNKGTNFTLVNTNVPQNASVDVADKPMIKINPATGELFVAGSTLFNVQTFAARSLDGGNTWTNFHCLATNVTDCRGADIAIAIDNTAYVFWLESSGSGLNFVNQLRYAAFLTNKTWSSSANFGSHLNSTNFDGNGQLLRFKGDDTNDWVSADSYPRVTYANSHIYVVYCDVSSPGSITDRGDIFLLESAINWTDHTLSVSSGPRKINNDRTQTDQWNPSIVANPAGTELFIGYYSRQEDPVTNSWIKAYGAKAYITNGLAQATFECIPIGLTNFLPFFNGTTNTTPPQDPWLFDSVWATQWVCLDSNAVPDGYYVSTDFPPCPAWGNNPFGVWTDNPYMNFCADDYTWSSADSNYFYFAWCDRSRTNGAPPHARPDADIRFSKIKQ